MAAPSPAAVWAERHDRALKGRQFSKQHRDFTHELLTIEHELRSELVIVKGRGWQPNPHQGDQEWAAAERRRIWGELGEWLGIGPPPRDFFGVDR
jgi:hypothetical protein